MLLDPASTMKDLVEQASVDEAKRIRIQWEIDRADHQKRLMPTLDGLTSALGAALGGLGR